MKRRSTVARDLHSPKYRQRRVERAKPQETRLRLSVYHEIVTYCDHCGDWGVDEHVGEKCPHCGGIA